MGKTLLCKSWYDIIPCVLSSLIWLFAQNLFVNLFKLPNLNESSVYCCDLIETGTDEKIFVVLI